MLKTKISTSLRRSSSKRRSSAKKKISNYLKIKKKQILSLVDYVKNQSFSIDNYMNIYNLLKNQKEKTMTLYRGNGDDKPHPDSINTGKWFSTTQNENIAFEEFSGEKCCVFMIHILNTKVLDVNKFVKDKISDYADEEEFLVLGGGNFYKNKECTQPGYNYLRIKNNKKYFECYYKVSEKSSRKSNKTIKKKYNLTEIIKIIQDDESSEFIENVDDLDIVFSDILKNVTLNDKKIILSNLLNQNKNLKKINIQKV